MTWEAVGAALLVLSSPAWKAWRAVSYLACAGRGRLIAMKAGTPDISAKEAFEMGRTAIMADVADGIMRLQWKELWKGLLYWRGEIREARLIIWKGIKRDTALFFMWFRSPKRAWHHWRDARLWRRQEKRDFLAERDRVQRLRNEMLEGKRRRAALASDVTAPTTPWATSPVDDDHRELRFQYDRIMSAPTSTDKDLFMLPQVLQGLQNYGDNPHAAWGQLAGEAPGAAVARFADVRPQAFLATPMLAGFMPQIAMGLAVFGVVGWGVAWERGLRLDHVKKDNATLKIENRALTDNRAAWIAAYDKERNAAQLARAGATVTAQTIEAERAQRRAVAAKQRRLESAAQQILGGQPPDWGSLLDDVGVRDETPAEPVSLTPASGDAGDPGRMQP